MKNIARTITTLVFSISFINSAVSLEQTPTLESIGPQDYEYCAANATNNSQAAVGMCTAEEGNAVQVAWIRFRNNTKIATLPPLLPNKSCTALRISERNEIYGTCISSTGQQTPVVWDGREPSLAPIALKPAGQDKSVTVTAVGATSLVGRSFTELEQKGTSRVVVWRFGSDVAEPVSSSPDNCVPTSMMEARTGYNWITLNCPVSTGNSIAKVATKAPNNLTYVITALQTPDNSSHCTLNNTNESGRTLGTCHYPNKALRTAYWQTLSSAPTTLNTVPQNASTILNDSGTALIIYQDAQDFYDGLWNIHQNKVTTIASLPKTAIFNTAGLADNGIVLLNTRTPQNENQGAYWSTSKETVGIGFFKGGKTSYLLGINHDGNYAVGSARGSDGKQYAIGFSLPE
ncbi:hypothetical protein [Pseudomonas sp. O230]|uniref:hypothetical protein n=1 Tax=Pseudomonas sp. O230 TaxID=3159450 RepID=UPI00387B3DC9